MTGTAASRTSARRVAAAVGAAVLAGLGVVPADVPTSVVAQSTVVHVASTLSAVAAPTTSPVVRR